MQLLRQILCAWLCLAVVAPARAGAPPRVGNIDDVFRDFEAICLNFAEHGYSLELPLLIEKAGFRSAGTSGGDDLFLSDTVEIVIGDKTCVFGMPNLPVEQMLEWTSRWTLSEGFAFRGIGVSEKGQPYWRWGTDGFDVLLQADRPLTSLIVERR